MRIDDTTRIARSALAAVVAACIAVAAAGPARGQAETSSNSKDTEQIDVGTVEDAAVVVPSELSLRVRLTALEPAAPAAIQWRHGGEGMGGDVIKGTMAAARVAGGGAPADAAADLLEIGQWSAPLPIASVRRPPWPDRLFLTFTAVWP
ncbi:MAG: hypothetical protein EBZ59_09220, partial [Planctomycetia bacterium]|nr:hypothetical protein [Planctomycetia bacterium]